MGPTVELSTGAYSDDTQLRLAVGRCVRAGGRFDVEAFSKIELPVFLSYELGAGRGTKAAARALTSRTTRWYSNFFDVRGVRYVEGGGNGAAMRVQPHIWAAPVRKPGAAFPSMLRDVVCTHGHPRALLGAALHAVALDAVLRDGRVPAPGRWRGMAQFVRRIQEDVRNDDVLNDRWLPAWERTSRTSWSEAIERHVLELEEQVHLAASAATRGTGANRREIYRELVLQLGGLDPRTRGAGTTSAVLALWLAWMYQSDPVEGVRAAATLLGSDTDTVATMAGALLGIIAEGEPPEMVDDAALITSEALRLERLGRGEEAESFPHPDPLRWTPPSTLADALGRRDGSLAVAGLGRVQAVSDVISGQGRTPGLWQWVVTEYRQHLLIKRRADLSELPEYARPRTRRTLHPVSGNDELVPLTQDQLFSSDPSRSNVNLPDDAEDAAALLASRGFDQRLMSRLLIHLARLDHGATKAGIFGALVAERLRADDAKQANARA